VHLRNVILQQHLLIKIRNTPLPPHTITGTITQVLPVEIVPDDLPLPFPGLHKVQNAILFEKKCCCTFKQIKTFESAPTILFDIAI